ncbi:GHKL domain-containing protein [Streptococcus uberis]|uniref:Sensor kinase n=2 Tax=Streptococcus uberis TaxID=1349 RepID=A0A6L6G6Q3_STRUB|nr:hypothetical protein [Streptococcus uberis]KHD40419.1 hypothetical protein NA32_04910 [Streptococcus hongkongensis]KKF41458.1 hypothetical protein AF61_01225 [Streptococcus uberis EF20/0145]KKF47501.1 hypothetical protein AF62_08975 [Streptococcus uberis C8329]KKF55361.1 hypothetical protein AF67_02320 [Streptococcus uberis 6780]KKF58190.1 hypothetical protein AF68_08680 [Streptococcus uberis B362]
MGHFQQEIIFHLARFFVGWIIFFMTCNEKVNWIRMLLMISFGMTGVLILRIPFQIVAISLMFAYHYYYHQNYKLRHHIFYSFFPFSILNLLYRLILLYILPFILNVPDTSISESLPHVILSVCIALPTFLFLMKVFSIETFSFIRHFSKHINLFLLISDIGIVSYLAFIPFVNANNSEMNWLRRIIILLYFVICLYLMSHLSTYARKLAIAQIEEEKNQHIELLEEYNSYIEEMYQSVKSFKHDYNNMLISLEGSIQTEGLDTIKKVYYSIVEQMETSIDRPLSINLEDFASVESFDLRTLLALRFYEANQKGIKTSIDISSHWKSRYVHSSDILVITSTIISLAIERAVNGDKSFLRLEFFRDKAGQTLRIISSVDTSLKGHGNDVLDLIDRTNLIVDAYLEKYPKMTYESYTKGPTSYQLLRLRQH